MRKFWTICLITVTVSFDLRAQRNSFVDSILTKAQEQYRIMLKEHQDIQMFPFTLTAAGDLKNSDAKWWTSGFFPGSLWYLYQYSGNRFWKKNADRWTVALEKEQYDISTHDLGFMLYCSYGNGYRLTKNQSYKKVLIQAAKSLSSRYHPSVGLIKSWDRFPPTGPDSLYKYPVIIDNMMNLELLTWASKISGDRHFSDIARNHADHTLKNHFRPDNSCYHVVCYSEIGKVLAKKTWQGFSDESAWARGQGWALYGFTMMYRETGNLKYLEQAQKVALYFLNNPHLPEDKIPYWDFNAPNIPDEERDVSAATVVASALLELSTYSKTHHALFFKSAETILKNLSKPAYSYSVGEGHGFLLKHSVGFKPRGGEINVPLNYADYYYLEALMRYRQCKNRKRKNY